MKHRLCLYALLGLSSTGWMLPAPLSANDTPPSGQAVLRGKVVALRQQRLEETARKHVLEAEKQTLDDSRQPAGKAAPVRTDDRYDSLLEKIEQRLYGAQGERQKALVKLAADYDARRDAALKSWRDVSLAILSIDDDFLAAEAQLGVLLDGRAAWSLWDNVLAWVVAWGCLLVVLGLVLAVHETRRGLRQQLRFWGRLGAAAGLLVAVGLSGCSVLPSQAPPGSSAPARLEKQQQELEAKEKQLTLDWRKDKAAGDKLQDAVDARRKELLDAWARRFAAEGAPADEGWGKLRAQFLGKEENAYQEVHKILLAAETAKHAVQDGQKIAAAVKVEHEKLASLVARERTHSLVQTGVRVGACLGFVYLDFLPLRRVRKRLRGQRALEAAQCPRCLAPEGLVLETAPVQDDRYPEPKHVHCPTCDYKFRASYRKLPRYCFPTVGIRASIPVFLACVLGSAASLETKFVQVSPAPTPDQAFTRSRGQARAVLLLHGFRPLLDKETKPTQAVFRDWQTSGSALVRALSREADVFAFAYSQNVPLERVSESRALADAVQQLRVLGYSERVLIGHSAGGVIARLWVEDNPEGGVTKVLQVCSPNRGSSFARAAFGFARGQEPFLRSLTPEARISSSEKRSGKRIAKAVQFLCVVGSAGTSGDGLVLALSQWPEDLQKQGIPCLRLATAHFTVMRSAQTTAKIAAAVRESCPRWEDAQVRAMKKALETE